MRPATSKPSSGHVFLNNRFKGTVAQDFCRKHFRYRFPLGGLLIKKIGDAAPQPLNQVPAMFFLNSRFKGTVAQEIL
jgi:hypothetical protein